MTAPVNVSFVMPAFNEEDNIAAAIAHVCTAAAGLCDDYEVIVVDDGSLDQTLERARLAASANSRVRVISHERNRGYGAALRTGFDAATLDLVFFTDADNQFDVAELELLLPWINKASAVVGYRIHRRDPIGRRLAAGTWNLLVRLLLYVPARDIDCAFKLFHREVLADMTLESTGAMVHTELLVKIARSGGSVVEVGVTHRPRLAGDAGGAHPRVILRALFELARTYRRLHSLDVGALRGQVPSS